MSSIIQSFQKRSTSLPVSQTGTTVHDETSKDEQGGIRRRLSSLSLKMQPMASPTTTDSWAFLHRSKSAAAAGSSLRKWWDWGWSWILSRKPVFAKDLEMNEEETKILGSHNKGSWRHVFYKVRSEFRKIVRSDNVGLPQTCRYDSFSYSKNFNDHGICTAAAPIPAQ
ncbi:uncharacterized protein LOC8285387 [Ricinus communis]|uniref:Uncharacterized protein n=1 Tax=Ricinus communis TaxID=3988 RepID=B9RKZ8_RICCO|nr:uncharacterized protein LOC8285387 [Ricinus communis]EEF48013.1 conserved hypothetical protein [Ricinus communis]|eukprot:XP_002514417.1 uncharacterized protein LOC8285387 [Ricinus communis]